MEDNKTEPAAPTGSYQIKSLHILESNFKRENRIDFSTDITNEIKVNKVPSLELEDEGAMDFDVIREVVVTGRQGDIKVFEHQIVITSSFTKEGEPKLPVESFKKVNAPAIMYPFVREHVQSTCLKAGMGSVILPPVNFTI